LFGGRTGDDADNVGALLGALINDRFDRAEAMTDENKTAVAALFEKGNRAVKIGDAIFEILIGRAAELGEVRRPRDPVMAAGIMTKL
jgi:hypothetical protein